MHHSEQFEPVLTAARAGAEWAWIRLYEDLTGKLLGYVRRQGATAPEDLVAETWLHVARNLPRFEGDEAAFRSWVFTVAHHRVIDERRWLRRRPVVPLKDGEYDERLLPSVESSEDAAMRAATNADLLGLLDDLSADQREVLLLRFFAGFGVAETGKIVGKSPGAVQALQGRALKRLQKKLRQDRKLSPDSSVTEVR